MRIQLEHDIFHLLREQVLEWQHFHFDIAFESIKGGEESWEQFLIHLSLESYR